MEHCIACSVELKRARRFLHRPPLAPFPSAAPRPPAVLHPPLPLSYVPGPFVPWLRRAEDVANFLAD